MKKQEKKLLELNLFFFFFTLELEIKECEYVPHTVLEEAAHFKVKQKL